MPKNMKKRSILYLYIVLEDFFDFFQFFLSFRVSDYFAEFAQNVRIRSAYAFTDNTMCRMILSE